MTSQDQPLDTYEVSFKIYLIDKPIVSSTTFSAHDSFSFASKLIAYMNEHFSDHIERNGRVEVIDGNQLVVAPITKQGTFILAEGDAIKQHVVNGSRKFHAWWMPMEVHQNELVESIDDQAGLDLLTSVASKIDKKVPQSETKKSHVVEPKAAPKAQSKPATVTNTNVSAKPAPATTSAQAPPARPTPVTSANNTNINNTNVTSINTSNSNGGNAWWIVLVVVIIVVILLVLGGLYAYSRTHKKK